MKKEQMWEIIDGEMKRPDRCIICGTLTQSRGVFVPSDPENWGLGSPPEGKRRMVLYPLCEVHARAR